jgi:hypothetical protein
MSHPQWPPYTVCKASGDTVVAWQAMCDSLLRRKSTRRDETMNDEDRALLMTLEELRARQRAEDEVARATRLQEARLREAQLLHRVSQRRGGLRALFLTAWR